MLSTRCSQDYVIHTLFTPCSQTGSASLKLQSKLDRKSVVPRSTDIVRADHRQADNLQASWPPGSHQGAVAYSENGVKELARLFRKRECRCRGRSLLPCCAGCFEPLSGKASSASLVASDRCSGRAHKSSGVQCGRCVGPDSVDQWPGDNGSGSGRVACIVRLLRLVAPPLPVTFSVTV